MRAADRAGRYGAEAGRIVERWRARGFRSHDPYDGLETRLVPNAGRLPRPLRLALVQLHKRSPVNLRPLFRIPPSRNAYADGLFASAALWLARAGLGDGLRAAAADCLAALEATSIRGGWTYPFDVQTKTFFYPRSTPNVVSTAFAARAFADAARIASEPAAAATAERAARFCVQELLVEEGDRTWFGYLPGDRALIHNANLLAARLCAEAGALSGDEDLGRTGLAAARTTLADQRADGAFRYGIGPHLAWIDGHHTGFVVECLADLSRLGLTEGSEPLERASAFYAERLFTPEGAARPAPDRDHPVDAIAAAQGIQTFVVLGDLERAERIAGWALANLRNARGGYVFQRGRLHRKPVAYARWSEAPMALALARLAAALRNGGG
jgi:polysaccharide biosynthesis protein VpsJ